MQKAAIFIILYRNKSNTYDFGLALVWINMSYTDNEKERTARTTIHHLKPGETKEIRLCIDTLYSRQPFKKIIPEVCNEERFKNFKPVEIIAYKYKNEKR